MRNLLGPLNNLLAVMITIMYVFTEIGMALFGGQVTKTSPNIGNIPKGTFLYIGDNAATSLPACPPNNAATARSIQPGSLLLLPGWSWRHVASQMMIDCGASYAAKGMSGGRPFTAVYIATHAHTPRCGASTRAHACRAHECRSCFVHERPRAPGQRERVRVKRERV